MYPFHTFELYHKIHFMNKQNFLLLLTIVINVIALAQTKTIVHFDSNKSDLKPAAIKTLDSLRDFLKDKSCWMVDATGYCDNTGNKDFNQMLSVKRADAVYNYIKANYKNSIRALSSSGHSSSAPIGNNSTEEGKAKNRRVEIFYTLVESPEVVAEKVVESMPEKKETNAVMEKSKTLDENSKIEDLEVGKILVLENLNFVGGISTLLKESEPSLKLLLKVLKENPTMEIEIEGHVCCANDMALSVDRALTVMEYLVNNGIKEKRLKYAGHSWNNPIASDQTEEGRKQNRRVEIMILKK